MLFLWCKAKFSSSLLQFSESRDLIEIITIYLTQETFLIISFIFCVEMVIHYFFYKLKFNQQHLSNILITFVNAFIK